MIEIVRIVEDQENLSSYRATQNEERARQLESLIESTKPRNDYSDWHPLIATPFRYSPPHPHARFRPTYGRNVFYGSLIEETALYEHAFHFMRERRHLKIETEMGTRTLFFVDAENQSSVSIRPNKHRTSIMAKNNYAPSQEFVEQNPQITFLLYPSCRDPMERDNAAILDILYLEKYPKWQSSINYFYNNKMSDLIWINYQLRINWKEVS